MNAISNTAHKITEIASRWNAVEELQPARVGEGVWQNELLLFIKPEVFLVSEATQSEKIVDLILDKIREFDVHIEGVSVLGGRVLEEQDIMSQHYGFINILSRSAAKILNADDRREVEDALGISASGYDILGGHEYLEQFPEKTSSDLKHLWFLKNPTKIRSGFYVRHVEKDGKDLILVNGFYPEQLSYFTNPSHKIVLMLLHSNTNWSLLKHEMVGATFPENAVPKSIRGILHTHAIEYGFESVTIANNCVHLSAGPFEAMFEIVNFFGKVMDMDIRKQPPLVLQRMLKVGIDCKQAVSTLDNPLITRSGKLVNLFTATEDMNSDEAVSFFKQSL